MSEHPNTIDINNLSFEDALKELEAVVMKLEDGKAPLEEAVQAYEKGAALKEHCDSLLKSARLKIHEIMTVQNSDITVKPSSLQNLIPE